MGGLAAKAIASVQRFQQQAAGLLLYQSVLETPISRAWLNLLDALCREDSAECLIAYGHWFRELAAAQQTWQGHLIEQIVRSDNPSRNWPSASQCRNCPPPFYMPPRVTCVVSGASMLVEVSNSVNGCKRFAKCPRLLSCGT